jgi:hypothetical protein
MVRIKSFITTLILFTAFSGLQGQKMTDKHLFTGSTYGSNKVNRVYIPPPEGFLKKLSEKGGATINVYYTGFTTAAKNAVEYAVSILESVLPEDVHISIIANWKNINTSGVLANSSSTGYALGSGINAFKPWAIYPAALAEKLAGKALNGETEGDIELNINSSESWYFGIDGNTPTLRYDLVTVVIHEIIHGLGFFDSFYAESATGSYGAESIPFIYDTFVEDFDGFLLTDTNRYKNPSAALKNQITGRLLWFDGPVVSSHLGGLRARLYAPTAFDPGSSIAHLDEDTYQASSGNALMTPFIARGEAIHNPGALTMAMLGDLGWINTRIVHQELKDTEEAVSSLTVNAEIISDTSFNRNNVSLTWSYDNFKTSSSTLMTAPASGNMFTADIPVPSYESRIDYFISTNDYFARSFLMPSDTSSPFSVYVGTDTVKPFIQHFAADYYFSIIDTIQIAARADDNIEVDTVYIEYRVNEGPVNYEGMQHRNKTDYIVYLNAKLLSLHGGDSLQYRITAIDKAASPNMRTIPSDGFFSVKIEQINAVQESYTTNFANSAGDFLTSGFTVASPQGFTNFGLHTKHPYESPEESGDSIGYIAMLRTPVRFDESGMMISFNEVVLVEPGEEGAPFGDDYFYDYVAVEGSKDFGKSWFYLADGYDSRLKDQWLDAYNNSIVGNNSTFTGSSSNLMNHTIFPKVSLFISPGDTMLVRFRLFSDPYANGWGWCIENLHIGPVIDNVNEITISPAVIWPNPGRGIINLRIPPGTTPGPLKYSVFNATGTCILTRFTDGSPETTVDISSYPSGIYFIVFNQGTRIHTLKYNLIK